MGGRSDSPSLTPDREMWIQSISDTRLHNYDSLMKSSSASIRLDGSSRNQVYFSNLINTEKQRRGIK